MIKKRFPRYSSVFTCLHELFAERPLYNMEMVGEEPRFFFGVLDNFGYSPYAEKKRGDVASRSSEASFLYTVLRHAYWGPNASCLGPIPWQGWGRAAEARWSEFDGVSYLLSCFFLGVDSREEYWRSDVLFRLFDREEGLCVHWLIFSWFRDLLLSERTLSIRDTWPTKERKDLEMIENAWGFLSENYLCLQESPLSRLLGILLASSCAETPACLVGLLSLHEEALLAKDLFFPNVYSWQAWEDWEVASRLEQLVLEQAREQGEACVESLARLLGNPHENSRQLVVQALGESGAPKALMPLLGSLRDPSEWVRLSAIEALGSLGALARMGTEALREAISVEKGPLLEKLYALLHELESPTFEGFRAQLEELLFS